MKRNAALPALTLSLWFFPWFLGVGCASAQTQQYDSISEASRSGMSKFLERYESDRSDLNSFYSMQRAPSTLQRQEELDSLWRDGLQKLDYEALDNGERVDYHLLQTELTYRGARRGLLRNQLELATPYMPFQGAIIDLETARWQAGDLDLDQAAQTLQRIAEQAEEIRMGLKDGASAGEDETPELALPDAPHALRLSYWTQAARRDLATWRNHYAKFLPAFEWWCATPYTEAREQLQKLADHLKEEIAEQKGEDDDPMVGQPIGAKALAIELTHEWLAYSPEELIAIGEREFAWCEQEMAKASQELGFGEDVGKALEFVKNKHVAPGEQDALVVAQAREAIQWLKSNDLVSIPALCEETWRVRMIDERTQRTLPFAAYGGQNMMVAFPTSAMDHESKSMAMRGNNRHFTRCVTPHELIPGHHLQGFMAQRYSTWRRPFRTPFLVEGWALYWEMVEYESGWPKSAEDRVGMLFWRMHRAARIIVSLRYHLGEMEPEAMIDFLVERVGHERDNAASEVRRYIGPDYSALYQCGYMIGGLQLRALGEEAVGPNRRTAKQYHDAILLENSIPVELIRASLLGISLERDAGPTWRPLF
jgi:uncharacterized protein (DUF885 family)